MKNILVTGGTGQVGRELQVLFPDAIFVSSKDYNLTLCTDVERMIREIQPDTVIHCAARVGGILDNITHQTEYFTENVLMNTLLVDACLRNNVPNFIGILSTCIYPDVVDTYPMTEEVMHDGKPTITNFSYGIAKRAMASHIDAIREQHNKNYCYIIPCNLYGIHDKYNDRSHFIGAVLKKVYEANKRGEKQIHLFGTGRPLRQILYARDLANVLKLMVDNNVYENFNIANEDNYSINDYATIILEALELNDWVIEYDSTKPDGQYRKDVSLNKFRKLFPNFEFTSFKSGIVEVYKNMNIE
jgi:GDP-L-fucose synthase